MSSGSKLISFLLLGLLAIPAFGQTTTSADTLPDRARQLAMARAEHDQAAMEYQNAVADLGRQRQLADRRFEASKEYAGAKGAVEDAAAAYNARRREAIDDLVKNNDHYAELEGQREAIEMAIDNARKSPELSKDVMAQLYEKKGEITSEMKGIEDAAFGKAGVNDRRAKWTEAVQDLQAIKARHRAEIDASAELVQAKERVNGARERLGRASAQLAAASAAYGQAYAQAADEQAQQEYYRRHYAPPFTWYPAYDYGGGYGPYYPQRGPYYP